MQVPSKLRMQDEAIEKSLNRNGRPQGFPFLCAGAAGGKCHSHVCGRLLTCCRTLPGTSRLRLNVPGCQGGALQAPQGLRAARHNFGYKLLQ